MSRSQREAGRSPPAVTCRDWGLGDEAGRLAASHGRLPKSFVKIGRARGQYRTTARTINENHHHYQNIFLPSGMTIGDFFC